MPWIYHFCTVCFVQLLFEGSIGKYTDIIDDWIQYAQGNGLWSHLHSWADILLISSVNELWNTNSPSASSVTFFCSYLYNLFVCQCVWVPQILTVALTTIPEWCSFCSELSIVNIWQHQQFTCVGFIVFLVCHLDHALASSNIHCSLTCIIMFCCPLHHLVTPKS